MIAGRSFAERVSSRRLASGTLAVLTNPHAPTVTIAGTLPKSLIGELIKGGAEVKSEDMQKLMQ